MSTVLKDEISRGEDLATAALQQVFGLTLDPSASTSSPSASSQRQPTTTAKPQDRDAGTGTASASRTGDAKPFLASSHASDQKRHLLLACSGSVATIKLPQLLQALSAHAAQLSIRVILTSAARQFLRGQAAEQPEASGLVGIAGVDGIYYDRDEWEPAWRRGAGILHIELRRWADALVVAPLSANTMGKVVGGLCDDLLTSVVRAWDTEGVVGFGRGEVGETGGLRQGSLDEGEGEVALATKDARARKMILVAPAMNTAMWRHPLTAQQIKVLEQWEWVRVLRPVEKSLACGDVGTGAMKEWSEIVKDIEELLHLPTTTTK